MKDNIHPKYYPNARIICACGNTFTTGSTRPELRVELCSKCHPFFTGQQKFVDTKGKIEKFKEKRAKAAEIKLKLKAKKAKEKVREEYRPKTLKEMLMGKS